MDEQVQKLRYSFKIIKECDMCGDPVEGHKIVGQRLNKSQGMKPKSKYGISVSVMRCKNCGLIYSSPQPIPHSLQDHYAIPAETYWGGEYLKYDKSFYAAELQTAKKILNFKPGMKALDVGSGIGKVMLSAVNAGFDAYGLEPSETFHRKAIELNNISPDKLLLASIEDAVYEDNTFDFISLKAVAEHIYTPSDSLGKMVRWLKPGGLICVDAPSADYFITSFIDTFYKLTGTNYTSHISPMHDPFHLFEFTLKSFEENGKRNNYKVISHKYEVCNIPFFPKMLHPILRTYMNAANRGMDIGVWLQKNS